MLKLKDVSKFYYNKGVIASGFSKISLEFELGEFVVITGESGSGKSTLLNVLSGTDSYEEGEMYINGQETSHYTEADFEDYRKKYIGNIFQNFNLVNSYSVYQNVELVLLINGYKKKEIKEKILGILKQVDLYRFRNTKVSKLSGGQKQRVAIARALAKETPIIIADEPTGNLDSRSAANVLDTLHKISKDKLVIIVTHNYDQVEEYATRKIKMHDGKIAEDKIIEKVKEEITPVASQYKDILKINKFRLALRNTFNIIPKFLLIFCVYLFIIAALLATYSSFKKLEYEQGKFGYNGYFQNTDDKRIVVKKEDGSHFTEDDFAKIESLPNVKYLVKDDLTLDSTISMSSNDLYLYGLVKNVDVFEGTLDEGRMPEAENEVIIVGRKDDYIFQMKDELLNNNFKLVDNYTGLSSEENYKVVGFKYSKTAGFYGQYDFYCSEKLLAEIKENSNTYFSKIEVLFAGKNYPTDYWNPYMQVEPNKNVPAGKAYVSDDLSYNCTYFNCKNKKIEISTNNIYYDKLISVTISKTYTKNNFKSLTDLKNFQDHNGKIFINPDDYKMLFDENYYQSSVFVNDVKDIDVTNTELKSLGIKTLMMKDALVNYDQSATQIIKIIKVVVMIILVVVMFFISYFIIKLILKSRNIYFTTVRILGASKKVCKNLLDIELMTVSNLSYILVVGTLVLVGTEVLKVTYIKDLMTYLKVTDYIIIYIITIIMTQMISSKFSKSLFKKSAMKTFNEEV